MNGLIGRRIFAMASWVSVRLNWRNSSVSVSFLAPDARISTRLNEYKRIVTFWDGQKADDHKSVLVRPPHVILDVAD